jgi:hypothetical protein
MAIKKKAVLKVSAEAKKPKSKTGLKSTKSGKVIVYKKKK